MVDSYCDGKGRYYGEWFETKLNPNDIHYKLRVHANSPCNFPPVIFRFNQPTMWKQQQVYYNRFEWQQGIYDYLIFCFKSRAIYIVPDYH